MNDQRRGWIALGIITAVVAVAMIGLQLGSASEDDLDVATKEVLSEMEQRFYETQVAQVEATRRGCERTNDRLRPVYDFFGDAIHKLRTVDRPAASNAGATAAIDASIKDFRARQDDMVEAVADVAKYPGSPEASCEDAFALPPPPKGVAIAAGLP